MHDNLRRNGPPCRKCRQPTIFHSVQIVHSREGEEAMQVFFCERCDLLSAQKSTPGAAAA
jgi:hypothetical protein